MPLRPRRARRVVAALVLATAGACYDYLPVRSSTRAITGSEVELALTDSGSVVEARTIGPSSTAIVGTFLGDSAGSYLIAARLVRRRDAGATTWMGERLAVPHALVASLNARRLSKTRSTLAGLGIVAAIIGARQAVVHGGGANSGKDNGGTGRPPQ